MFTSVGAVPSTQSAGMLVLIVAAPWRGENGAISALNVPIPSTAPSCSVIVPVIGAPPSAIVTV